MIIGKDRKDIVEIIQNSIHYLPLVKAIISAVVILTIGALQESRKR
jgi:hypothetical protein